MEPAGRPSRARALPLQFCFGRVPLYHPQSLPSFFIFFVPTGKRNTEAGSSSNSSFKLYSHSFVFIIIIIIIIITPFFLKKLIFRAMIS